MKKSGAIVGCCLAALAVGVSAVLFTDGSAGRPRKKGRVIGPRKSESGQAKPPGAAERPDGYLAEALVRSHWTSEAAREVERATEASWGRPSQEWDAHNPRAVPLLQGLGQYPSLMALLAARPECAALLACSGSPERLGRLLGGLKDRDYKVVVGWFQKHPAAADADLLLAALERHMPLLTALWDRQFIDAERLFMFDASTPAGKEYDAWLAGLVRAEVLSKPASEGQSSLLTFVSAQGRQLRARMADDAGFRRRFRPALWPRFAKLAAPDLWDAYAALPGTWKVLEEHDGAELIQKYYQLPALLLASDEAYPEGLRGVVLRAMRDEDLLLLAALERCRNEPSFKELLKRRKELTEFAFRNILGKLVSYGPDPAAQRADGSSSDERTAAEGRRKVLREVEGWPAETIEKKYGGREDPFLIQLIPGYDVYNLLDKAADGRDVSLGDVAAAAWDVGSFFFPAGKATGAAKAGRGAAGAAARDLARDQAARLVARDQVAGLVARQGRRLGKEAVGATSEHFARQVLRNKASAASRSYLIGAGLRSVQRPLQEMATSRQAVDLTGLFRLLGEQSGVGVSSLGPLARWEARFFAREGGRLFASLNTDRLGKAATEALIASVGKQAVLAVVTAETDPHALDRAWRRNVYGWWAAQLAGRAR